MKRFDYTRPTNTGTALSSLDAAHVPFAGGTDLLTRMKLGITTPAAVIDIKALELPADISSADDGGLRIGALATLADVERHAFEPGHRLLAEAAAQAATPQIRARATVGGNLLQRPRCWYFRDPDIDCWLKGGDGCPARGGRNQHHAIVDHSPCVAVHPSDLASCLVALGARVRIATSDDGEREVALDDFLHPPSEERVREHTLADDELVVRIDVPGDTGHGRVSSTYLKAMDRKTWAFALVGLAAVVRVDDDEITSMSLVASGVANVPWRLAAAETALAGERASLEAIDASGALEAALDVDLARTAPLSGNAYKVDLLRRLVREAVGRVVTQGARA